jgi:hypothetical protein
MPYQREAEIVLAMWRDVERDLANADSGSDLAEQLRAQASRLRDEYQRLIAEATDHDRPVPPEFPELSTA